jgi:membrane-bound lytic murein transglycosylase B
LPGEPNFAAVQAWNAASVDEEAIAIIGQQIDGDETPDQRAFGLRAAFA